MDFATLVGLIGALVLISSAVILGASPDVFLNSASLIIVVGGSLLVVLSKFSFAQFLGAFKAAMEVQGLISSATMTAPLKTLDDKVLDQIRTIVKEAGLIG